MSTRRDWYRLLGGVVVASRTVLGVAAWHAQLTPDTGLYVNGGSWWYPSVLGRAIGASTGYAGLAVLSVIAGGVVGWVLVDAVGRRGVLAALLVPAAWYLIPVGVDAAAAACILLLVYRGGGLARSLSLVAIATGLHVAALPLAVGVIAYKWRHSRWVWSAIGLALVVAVTYSTATTYGEAYASLGAPGAMLRRAVLTLVYALGPIVLIAAAVRGTVPRRGAALAAIALTAAGAAEASLVGTVQVRYALPGAVMYAAEALR